jgi:hypothetical protein
MRIAILPIATALVLGLTSMAAADEPPAHIIIKEHTRVVRPGQKYFDQHHNDAWAWDALKELAGARPADDATPEQLAAETAKLLANLPEYGQKSVARLQSESNPVRDWVGHIYGEASGGKTAAMMQPIPDWFMGGYLRFKGASVQRSRYFDGVNAGTLEPNPDIAALYAYWSLYDAEWFSLSRRPGFKAWLSAVALTYPPHWINLRDESAAELHSRLVAPLQTPDEPWREIDNWINNFTAPVSSGELGAFIKPKVRDALVQELLAAAGEETDARFYEQRAYKAVAPERVGLNDRQFFLLGALTLEYFQELYAADPNLKETLFFRDYFVNSFRDSL